jgi:hypothetical protein
MIYRIYLRSQPDLMVKETLDPIAYLITICESRVTVKTVIEMFLIQQLPVSVQLKP